MEMIRTTSLTEMKHKLSKDTCKDHCSKWMRGHPHNECKFANHLMSSESSDDEYDGAAGDIVEGATAESESEPKPKEAYRVVNSTGN